MHRQMFLKADNDDGYISCIVHRERYLEEFKALGFVETVEDLKRDGEPREEEKPKRRVGRPRKTEA